MDKRTINRLKVVPVEKQLTGKWFTNRFGKSVTTVFRWCTNETQPSLEILTDFATC